ncbi:MAG: lysophospholipase [Pseudomonadota bacterium]
MAIAASLKKSMGILCFLIVTACVSFPEAPPIKAQPVLAANVVQAQDGALLGLNAWHAENPKAVILAVHGMNDYSNAFAMAGEWWAENAGFTTYAIDQRGFGRSPAFGRWVGSETLKADLRASVEALRIAHPDKPLYIIGHSMGAAVVMAAEADAPLNADGLVLAAPGVWGGKALPLTHRMAANFSAMLAPGKTLTGERAGRQASDNIDVLRAMGRDPLVIKETRVDAVLGVVRVMGEAYGAADAVCAPTLFLIGDKDEIIPHKAMEKTAERLCGDKTLIRYEDGWHLLFRDLQAETVWRDVAEWINLSAQQRENTAGG